MSAQFPKGAMAETWRRTTAKKRVPRPGPRHAVLAPRTSGEPPAPPDRLIAEDFHPDDSVSRIEQPAGQSPRFDPEAVPFQVYSSGVGLDRGAGDPRWEIVSVSTERNYRPRPAVVLEPLGCYIRDDRDTAQWLSNSKLPANMPAGARWTFRTHFNLSGFDPASAVGGTHRRGRLYRRDTTEWPQFQSAGGAAATALVLETGAHPARRGFRAGRQRFGGRAGERRRAGGVQHHGAVHAVGRDCPADEMKEVTDLSQSPSYSGS